MPALPNLPPGSHVCIVGGGSSGVFAIRECLKAGLHPTLYEATDSSGGVWNPRQGHWDSLTTNSSFEMMEVCGFPFPFQPSNNFPSRSEICDYIAAFIDKFHLSPYIQYDTTVVTVEPTTAPGTNTTLPTRWTVTTSKHHIHFTSYFDAVIVASGQFNLPKLPLCLTPIPLAQSGFAGQVLHSRDFRSGKDYKNLNVLVLGLGNSSLDVALECATVGNAASVTVACRRGSILLPVRKDDGNAIDQHVLTRFFQNVQPSMVKNYRMMAEAQQITNAFIKAGMPSPSTGGRDAFISQRVSNLKEKEQWLKLLMQENSKLSLHPSGLKGVHPGNKCSFFDGSTMDNVDVIISCTGYVLGKFPFLNHENLMADCTDRYVVNSTSSTSNGTSNNETNNMPPPTAVTALNLYRRIMHPVHPTLCFLAQFTGFANEAACAQLQARWICNTWSSSALSLDQMRLECTKRREFWQRSKPLFPQFVTVTRYLDALASDIGCMPPKINHIWTWLSDPQLAWQLLFGPIVPAQYSLQGNDVTKEVARLSRDLIVGRIKRRSRL